MNTILIYGIIFVILIALELVYFKIADTFNIIDKPNERSMPFDDCSEGWWNYFSF